MSMPSLPFVLLLVNILDSNCFVIVILHVIIRRTFILQVTGDIWWKMRADHMCVPDDPRRSITKQVLITWLIPLIISICVISLDHLPIPSIFQPKFGGCACWFLNRYAWFAYFVFSIATCTIINILLFITTSISVRKAFKIAANLQKACKNINEIIVYGKMFVLVGGTWLFGFLAMAVNMQFMWYVFTLLNGSQGVFLFFVLVVNWKKITQIICGTNTGQLNENVKADIIDTPSVNV